MNTQPAPENPEYTFDTVQLMGVFDQIIRDSSWHLFARFLTRQLNTGNLELKNLKTILERVANTPNLDKDPAMQDMSKKCVAAIVGYFNSNFNELFQISSDNIEGMRCLSIIGKLIDSLKEGFLENTYRENDLALLIRTLDIFINLSGTSLWLDLTVAENVNTALGQPSRSADIVDLNKMEPPDTARAPLVVDTVRREGPTDITFNRFQDTVQATASMEIPTTPDELNTTSLDIARAEVEDKPIRAETETQARARAIIAVTQARAEANDRDRAQAARAQSEVHVSTASLPATGTAVVRPPLVRDNTPDEYEKSPLLGAHIGNLRPITIRTLGVGTDVFLEIIDIFTRGKNPIVGIVCKKNNKVETFAINIDDTRVGESGLRILGHYKNGEVIPMIDPKRSFFDRFRKTLPYTPTYDLASIQSKKRIDTQTTMPSPVVPTQTVATSKNTTEDTNMLHGGSIGDHLANFRKNNPIVIDTVEYGEISIIAIANSSEKHIKKAQFLIAETGKTKEYAIDIRCRTGDNPKGFVGWYDANSILQRFTERYSTHTQRGEITGRKSIDGKPLNIRSIRSKKIISVYSSVKQNLRNLVRVGGGTGESSPQIANNIQVNSTNTIKGNIPKTQPEEIRATIRNGYLTGGNLSEHAKNLRAGNEISISIGGRDYQIHQMSEPKPGYSQWIKVRKKGGDGNFSDERIYEIELSEFTAGKQVKLIPVLHNGEKYTVNKTEAKVFHLEQIYSELAKSHSNSQPPTSWVKKSIQSAGNIVSHGWNKLFGSK